MQIVTIVDDQGPVLTGIPKDDCGSATIPPVVTARDACSGLDYPVTFTETEGNTDCGKVIIRTWTATDNCGNISTHSYEITVRENWLAMLKKFRICWLIMESMPCQRVTIVVDMLI